MVRQEHEDMVGRSWESGLRKAELARRIGIPKVQIDRDARREIPCSLLDAAPGKPSELSGAVVNCVRSDDGERFGHGRSVSGMPAGIAIRLNVGKAAYRPRNRRKLLAGLGGHHQGRVMARGAPISLRAGRVQPNWELGAA